ncbi:MAG: molybdopterin molybdotransferase MoeA, partial [Acidobacteriaceae bacterium]|nr:molybdopterin molybdotransferase MoeA [Acidobacteriaceae bacterium]
MAAQAQEEPALDFEEARRIVIMAVRSLAVQREPEVVSLDEAYGRILSENALADRDYPAIRRSLRDGFAIRSSDVPGTLRVRGEVRAGDAPHQPLQSGEALEIMTGASVPEGADAVVMIENVARSGSSVQVDRPAEPGQFVNEKGAECRSGSTLIAAGTRLDASHIATLAMTGKATISVIRRPSVAILATGDEIVAIDGKPAAHEIRNSNSHMLAALVRATGGVPTILPVARDAPDILRPLIEDGIKHSMLVVSGGVSAGKYDFVKPGLREFGAHFHFERVRVQPGQPTVFGTVANKPVFGLPGNPGSTLITYQLF